jgi:hypothetical protein
MTASNQPVQKEERHRGWEFTSVYPVTLPSIPDRMKVKDVGGGAGADVKRFGMNISWFQCLAGYILVVTGTAMKIRL